MCNHLFKFRCLWSLLTFFTLAVSSASSADMLDELRAKQAKIKTVSAEFAQEKKTRLLAKPVRAEGRFLYRQPDRIRWEYRGSMNMQVIFNGRDIWIYYPDLKEADKLSGLSQYGSMLQFDLLSMSRDYTVNAKKDRNMISLTFIPKTKGFISRIEMEIPEEASFPRMVRLFDQNKDATTIMFSEVKINHEIKETLFTFAPEAGVIVRERSLK